MKKIYPFTSKTLPNLKEVGGKAKSLIIMTQENFSVPNGFALAVDFFEDWLDTVTKSGEWKAFLSCREEEIKAKCDIVKKICKNLKFTDSQKKELEEALKVFSKKSFFAIRSSSPEEDLEGTSFAGGYETILGVTEKTIEKAILHCFTSVFDERIVKYKMQHGMKTDRPRIAVIVQEQIASEASGVAFSLNPLNNCFDEALINTNFGLGETVVAGQVTPDTFIVNKVKMEIIEKKIGSKDHAIWLTKNGGTEEKKNENPDRASLTDKQAKEVARLAQNVEKYYDKPMDIEWAYANENLYLLQARPITAYFPLSDFLRTEPGEAKHLYMNLGLVKQGIKGLMSPMGVDMLAYMTDFIGGEMFTSTILRDAKNGIDIIEGGLEVSQVGNKQKMFGKKINRMNLNIGGQSVVDTYDAIDMKEYMPKKLPKILKIFRKKLIFLVLKQVFPLLKVLWHPQKYLLQYKKNDIKRTKEHKKLFQNKYSSLESAIKDAMKANFTALIEETTAVVGVARIAKSSINRIFKKDDVKDLLVNLEMALPGNKTSEMGQAMYELAKQPEILEAQNAKEFIKKLNAQDYSKNFLEMWDEYITVHGFRGMGELDIATPRSYENLEALFQTIKDMSKRVKNESEDVFEISRKKRKEAYEQLCKIAEKKSERKLKKFKKKYEILIALGGLRESQKYNMIRAFDFVRRQAPKFADGFVKDKRIDRREDIFNLKVREVDKGLKDSKYDLWACIEKNTAYAKKLGNRDVPVFFDSRGKIFRPPVKNTEGALVGEPISPGTVTGKVKVCISAHDKRILPGEILVAKATDPGWTPLFVNAGGIILENGGALQHGAVVAREYGKPCVSSVVDAVKILKDGQEVEVDGSSGIVKIIK
jgi:pyruvate,water dikinase